MLYYIKQSLFDSPAQTLVNTVNTVGIMGKGIAKEFKARFPEMYQEYRGLCDAGKLNIGALHLWKGDTRWVLNFPTKKHWKAPSEIEYIEAGLKKFVEVFPELGITSISFPLLGCGNGQLNWGDVRPIMERYLKQVPITVFIHDMQVTGDFVPEHISGGNYMPPDSFENFLRDIRSLLFSERGQFTPISSSKMFKADMTPDGDLLIILDTKNFIIPREELEVVWSILQVGVLSSDQYKDYMVREKAYLFAILFRLPYVEFAQIQHTRRKNEYFGHGLYFNRSSIGVSDASSYEGKQWQLI